MAQFPRHTSANSYLPDLVAGLSIAGLLVPEAVAYSGIANLPPRFGIIALFAGLVCYGLIGKSRFAVVSSTSSSAAVLAAATASLSGGNASLIFALAAGLIVLTGLFFIAAGFARLGPISDFIAKPVLRGFAFGLAIVIILKQLPKVMEVAPRHNDILRSALDILSQINHWNPYGVATCFIALAIMLALRQRRKIPAALLVIVLGIATQLLFGLDRYGVGLVGPIRLQFQAPSLPRLTWNEWLRLGELAFALLFVLYAESYGSIRSFALKHGDDFSANRDLVALGASNLVSGLLHGMPVGAGYSGTSANEAAGAQSRFAAWIAAVVVLAIVLTLLPYIELTPEPVLAAIVINAVSHTLNPGALKLYFRWRRDRLVAVAAVAAVLLLGILDGLLAAVGVSLLMTLRDLSVPKVSVLGRLGRGHDFVNMAAHPDAHQLSGLLIVRPEEPLFFANVDRMFAFVMRHVGKAGHGALHTVILSLEESPDLDGTSIEALQELVAQLTARGIRLEFARVKDSVREVLANASIPGLHAEALNNWSVDDAVRAAARRSV
jgi:high affinity sulfate transporter 1